MMLIIEKQAGANSGLVQTAYRNSNQGASHAGSSASVIGERDWRPRAVACARRRSGAGRRRGDDPRRGDADQSFGYRASDCFGDMRAAKMSGTKDKPLITAPISQNAMRALTARVGQSLPVVNEGAGTVIKAG